MLMVSHLIDAIRGRSYKYDWVLPKVRNHSLSDDLIVSLLIASEKFEFEKVPLEPRMAKHLSMKSVAIMAYA